MVVATDILVPQFQQFFLSELPCSHAKDGAVSSFEYLLVGKSVELRNSLQVPEI